MLRGLVLLGVMVSTPEARKLRGPNTSSPRALEGNNYQTNYVANYTSPQCSDAPVCAGLNLGGACCPTTDNVYLDCCYNIVIPYPKPPEDPNQKFDSPTCSANPTCAKLNLDGDCCPTADGTNLDCCYGIVFPYPVPTTPNADHPATSAGASTPAPTPAATAVATVATTPAPTSNATCTPLAGSCTFNTEGCCDGVCGNYADSFSLPSTCCYLHLYPCDPAHPEYCCSGTCYPPITTGLGAGVNLCGATR